MTTKAYAETAKELGYTEMVKELGKEFSRMKENFYRLTNNEKHEFSGRIRTLAATFGKEKSEVESDILAAIKSEQRTMSGKAEQFRAEGERTSEGMRINIISYGVSGIERLKLIDYIERFFGDNGEYRGGDSYKIAYIVIDKNGKMFWPGYNCLKEEIDALRSELKEEGFHEVWTHLS